MQSEHAYTILYTTIIRFHH